MQVKARRLGAALLLAGASTLTVFAQVSLAIPADQDGLRALDARSRKELGDLAKMHVSDDPAVNLDAMPAFIRQHPALSITKTGQNVYANYFASYVEPAHPEPKALDVKLYAVQEALQQTVPAYYLGTFNFMMAKSFDRLNLSESKTLAESGVALYSRSGCLLDDHFLAEAQEASKEKQAKHSLPFTYHIEDGEGHCAAESAARFALLGRIQANLGETEAAADSFQKALREHANMEAALGMATIDKAKGDKSAELEMLTQAYLTGTLPAENILEAKALYAQLYPSSAPDGYDALLDRRYAKTYVNPVKDLAASREPAHPQHVVLEELFTGAGCEPCVSPDLATEKALDRYTRDQVVVAVYHDNAPDPDPLTTNTSENRDQYYGIHGSTPHVFLDGEELELEEGPPNHAQSAFDLLTKTADSMHTAPSPARLNLVARRKGGLVEVTVTGNTGDLPAKTHLQILLLETEVSYSGENALRFQPMVVRAGANLKAEEMGFPVEHSTVLSQSYTFDLKNIEAENLAYYDHFREEMEKRMASFIATGNMSKAQVDKRAQFREPENLIHPDRLAVVAFLQSDDSKKVLQTSYATVLGGAQEGDMQ
jgi:hypothetical protein